MFETPKGSEKYSNFMNQATVRRDGWLVGFRETFYLRF